MKPAGWLLASLLVLRCGYADLHEPSVGVHYNFNDPQQSHLILEHQSSILLDEENILIINGLYKPYVDKSHHVQGGIGYRSFWDEFGIGLNFFWATTNKPRFFTHQFAPGIEIFVDHFQLSFNHYFPLTQTKIVKYKTFTFDRISEIDLTYRPSRRYEIGVATYYNHQKETFGVSGKASAFILDQWQISASPHYEKASKGLTVALTFHFGGTKSKETQSIRKSSTFFFTSQKIPKVEKVMPPMAFDPTPASPVFQPPIAKAEEAPPPPKPKSRWYDFFFTKWFRAKK